jgi:mitochondrial fission protein ELM1
MHEASASTTSEMGTAARARAWIISDGKAGHLAITTGVAEAMGLDYRVIPVSPRGLRRIFAPWAPVSPAKRPGSDTSPFRPPWPDFVFAAGRTTIPYLRSIHWAAARDTFTVAFQDPRTGTRTADLIWVPEHDRLRGENVITTPTAPHRFNAAMLERLRQTPPPEIAALPHPRMAVLLGGPSGAYGFTHQDVARMASLLVSAAAHGASFMVTVSRRTPPDLIASVGRAIEGVPGVFWKGCGDNPYAHFLACADIFLATADSINMTGEAAATGRPVYVFHPKGGRAKFARFHERLQAAGITRVAPDRFERLDTWTYPPINAAQHVAAEIYRRWQARKSA